MEKEMAIVTAIATAIAALALIESTTVNHKFPTTKLWHSKYKQSTKHFYLNQVFKLYLWTSLICNGAE